MNDSHIAPVIVTGGRQTGKTSKLLDIIESHARHGNRVIVFDRNFSLTDHIRERLQKRAMSSEELERIEIRVVRPTIVPIEVTEVTRQVTYVFCNLLITDGVTKELVSGNVVTAAPLYAEVDFMDQLRFLHTAAM